MSFCLYNYDKEEHRCSMQMVFQINHAVTGFIHGKIQTAWGHCSGFPWCCAARGALRIQSDTEPQADEDITTQYHRCIMMYQMLSKVNHPKNDLLPVQELLVYSIYIYIYTVYIYIYIYTYLYICYFVNTCKLSMFNLDDPGPKSRLGQILPADSADTRLSQPEVENSKARVRSSVVRVKTDRQKGPAWSKHRTKTPCEVHKAR